ncbi:MAG: lamin tail domain-containing protein [Thermoplasmatota archaeon]|nr:lamin tail domain-containing protein [Halobacteriales archaeon]
MRFIAAALVPVLLVAALPTPIQAQAEPARLVLSEIEADPDSAVGEREFVEVWNNGTTAVALAGWKVRDAPTASGATNTFTFPAWSLPPGGRVVVWGGGAADSLGPAWSNAAVWNNAGDAASLIDPAGHVVDWLGYGATAAPTGEMANKTLQAKPAHGQSLQLDGGRWVLGSPTPGTVLGAVQGGISLTVGNAAPAARFGAIPTSARPGSSVQVEVLPSDPNGEADVKSWTLSSGGTTYATGAAGGPATVTPTAPASGTSWVLDLKVTDQAGLTASAQATLPLRYSDLVVEMPAAGPLAFPTAGPGAATLDANAPVVVRNVGATDVVPRLDVSAFAGPTSFAAEGHVWVGWPDVTGNLTWSAYTGPLMHLPALAPGGTLAVTFRLRDLPLPLPAGTYGTSFAVVP